MKKIINCLLPVAGFGTRFLPVTKSIPKEMLPVLSKPLIQYAVEEAISAGITEISMVTNRYKRVIEEYFSFQGKIEKIIEGTPKETMLNELNFITSNCNFSYVEQKEMLGLGHAIHTGMNLVENKPFAVILPDDLCFNSGPSILQQMMAVYDKNSDCSIIAIEEVPKSEVEKYGIIEGDLVPGYRNLFRVASMVEKPLRNETTSNLAVIGRYILNPDIFEALKNIMPDKNGEIQITNALNKLAKEQKILALKFDGRRFDCGSIKGFVEANNEFAKIFL